MKLLKFKIVLFFIYTSSIAQNVTLNCIVIIVNSISILNIYNAHLINFKSIIAKISNNIYKRNLTI